MVAAGAGTVVKKKVKKVKSMPAEADARCHHGRQESEEAEEH